MLRVFDFEKNILKEKPQNNIYYQIQAFMFCINYINQSFSTEMQAYGGKNLPLKDLSLE